MRKLCPKISAGAAAPVAVSLRSIVSSTPRSSTNSSRTLVDRRVVADQLPDFGEPTLGVDGQVVVDDPQRHLDQLEVVEVAVGGGVERLLAACPA